MHASRCRDSDCPSTNCAKMKILLRHGATCNKRATGGCSTCRRIWMLLQIHARRCSVPSDKKCPVPRCADLKRLFSRKRKSSSSSSVKCKHCKIIGTSDEIINLGSHHNKECPRYLTSKRRKKSI